MWIYLLRHGLTEDAGPGCPDSERRLTQAGLELLTAARQTWQRIAPDPEVVLTSPFQRAQETAAIFADAVDFTGNLRQEPALVPHATPEAILPILEGELLTRTRSVAIVGHEPHLGYLLGSLLTGRANISIPLTKGMLVGVETDSASNVICNLRFSITQQIAANIS